VSIVVAALAAVAALPNFDLTVQLTAGLVIFMAGFAFSQRHKERVVARPVVAVVARSPDRATRFDRRSPANWIQLRISLKDALLGTVVAAVAFTAIVNSPGHHLSQWIFRLIDGLVIAILGLACAWLALGRARAPVRLLAAPFVIALAVLAVYVWLNWFSRSFASHFTSGRTSFAVFWQDLWTRFQRQWPGSIGDWIASVAVGVVAFAAWLRLAAMSNSKRYAWRWAFALCTFAIAALPTYMGIRLLTPPSLPPQAFESNDAYRELAAVANELFQVNGPDINPWSPRASDAQIAQLVARDEPQWRRVRAAIEKGCQFPWHLPPEKYEIGPIQVLSYMMLARIVRGDGSGAIEPKIEACLDFIRLADMEGRSSTERDGDFLRHDYEVQQALWSLRPQLAAEQCREILRVLCELELRRETRQEATQRWRLIKQDSGWRAHYDLVVWDLTGYRDPFYDLKAMLCRALIIEIAIRSYELEHGKPPAALADLAPAILDQVPDDPFAAGPFKYQPQGDSYLLYSIGLNGRDDGGQFDFNRPVETLDDWTADRMFQPPRPPRAAPAAAKGK
jgi:hypothetical protein